jgi:hypothetical protein
MTLSFRRAFLPSLRRGVLPAALCALAAAGASPAAADDPAVPVADALAPAPEPSPFAPFVERISIGEPLHLGTQTLILLWTPRDAVPRDPTTPRAWVGLSGTDARVLDLPAPIGNVLVHVTNPLTSPLYLPRGEALVPPIGLPRALDRAVWLAPGASAFVPAVQTVDAPAAGPYVDSDERPSPDSLRAMRLGSWPEFVAAQTTTLDRTGVAPLDPLRGYAVGVYPKDATVPHAAIEALRLAAPGPIVGYALGDLGGPSTIVIESDPARLRVQWAAIARGISLDEVTRRRRASPVLPPHAGVRHVAAVAAALRELAAPPALRPAFGEGEQARWPAGDAPARWIGLVLDGTPITATFHRRESPGPIPGPAGTTGTGPGNPPTEGDPVPGAAELGRKPNLTPFEERLQDRRDDRGGGVGGGTTPPAGGGSVPSGGGGGVPSGGGASSGGGSSPAPSGGGGGFGGGGGGGGGGGRFGD